ncbi:MULTISPECIES: N-acetylmuramoyl-L-alanine amidase [Asticcacaulis]|uniref:peptidoglycan recognition protein family protein n=1 Tax=Asticcacaulis TaxID=76890 RepID=UPI001AEB9A4C|nr:MULTISPECIES: N-acetylmuramoyl-L-alanine amidase [Asticcacaulis]MBP2157641.1 N-acetylmuramoyl-L-alanine amidase [Asticcacaulis solisilvae]MDR6798686.1 N-acetylmuramoyl-L-alanine amidase [Asticcacaulis sp. BE141]
MSLIDKPSPNFNERKGPPDMVVLHYTGMETAKAALDRLLDPDAKVSAHYVVDEDGSVYALVPEERRAWHAGVSYWRGETDINGCSIGVEIVNPGHEFGYRDFPAIQIDAVIGLLDGIRERWDIADSRILGHSDVAPARKEDPGERFPWKTLADHGHGLWVEPDLPPAGAMGPPLGPGDEGLGVFSLQSALGKLGYNVLGGGPYDDETLTIVRAFQRHWLPEVIGTEIEGRADAATRVRLMALLRHITLLEV